MILKDKVAVITGGGGGIGEGICLSMARAGAHVVVSDKQKEMAEKVAVKVRKEGQKAIVLQVDVRKAEECQRLIDETLSEMGRLDILVCAAGVLSLNENIYGPITLESISIDDWNLTIDVNLKGVFLCNRAVMPHFKEQKQGKIINVSSIAGRSGSDSMPHYSASKAGVIVLTQAVALQLARYNVNVNTICPGFIWTSMWESTANILSHCYREFRNMSTNEIFKVLVNRMIMMRRPQYSEDIGKTAVFLASDEAKEITGQVINVDGGAFFS